MRLIDADKLLYDDIKDIHGDTCMVVHAPEIDRAPTAFDQEKVIEELDKLTGEECTLHECGIRSERCKACIAKKAIEIVEKGGIE